VVLSFSNLFFWGEKYEKNLDRFWSKLPNSFGAFVASMAIFLLGITARGEWLLFAVGFSKWLNGNSENYMEESEELINSIGDWFQIRFKGYTAFLIGAFAVGYGMYFALGGFLHWYYYVRQRDTPETWKCQPKQWLSPKLERHEIMLGSLSLIFGNTISAAISTYVANGGWSQIYFNIGDYGLVWFILQWPVCFICQDYLTYLMHRMYHTPFLYKNFHKAHHTYKQPTAFSVTAIHPFEFVHMQLILMSPVFLFPMHYFSISVILMYIYYHGIIDHSGINFKRHWWQPWQPDCIFHDNHHQYFHVNFGFNIEFWDKLHGTYRRKDRIYHEDIYYGKGKSLDEATAEELEKDLEERVSENPLAYQGNQRHFDFNKEEIKKLKNNKIK